MEQSDRLDRLYLILPDYVSGTLWIVDIIFIAAFSMTYSHALIVVKRATTLLAQFNVPELAVGFLIAVAGIVLPYAIGIAFNTSLHPFVDVIYRRIHLKLESEYLESEHFQLAEREVQSLLGTKSPKAGVATVFRVALEHAASPALESIARGEFERRLRDLLMFPVSLLIALGVYAALGETGLALTAASVASIVVLGLLIHQSNTRYKQADELVFLAYLVARNCPRKAWQPPSKPLTMANEVGAD